MAWSSFTTGTNPGRHNIFDFLDRDPRTYLPRLSSAHIGSVDRVLKIGKLRLPLKKPDIRLLRKSCGTRKFTPSDDGVTYWAVRPPSITSSDPVTKEASSEARYSTP